MRTKLAKKLLNFGTRVQYSVFECNLNKEKLNQMKQEALQFVDLAKDSLRVYKICDTCSRQIESFGIKKGWEEQDEEVITV